MGCIWGAGWVGERAPAAHLRLAGLTSSTITPWQVPGQLGYDQLVPLLSPLLSAFASLARLAERSLDALGWLAAFLADVSSRHGVSTPLILTADRAALRAATTAAARGGYREPRDTWCLELCVTSCLVEQPRHDRVPGVVRVRVGKVSR